jgi:oligopeptidase A
MRDVETLFHEFGHAIHEMISASKLSELSGFNVEWDFVELPSQLLENWVSDRPSLEKLARHYQTGEKISDDILNRLDELKTYMSGSAVL